jgi:hypothetical protein
MTNLSIYKNKGNDNDRRGRIATTRKQENQKGHSIN